MRSESRPRRTAVGAASSSHCARVLGRETTGEPTVRSFGHKIICMERLRIRNTLELNEKFGGARDKLIGVLSARETMVMKRAAKVALPVTTGVAKNGGHSIDLLFVDLDGNVNGSSSTKPTLSRGLHKSKTGTF